MRGPPHSEIDQMNRSDTEPAARSTQERVASGHFFTGKEPRPEAGPGPLNRAPGPASAKAGAGLLGSGRPHGRPGEREKVFQSPWGRDHSPAFSRRPAPAMQLRTLVAISLQADRRKMARPARIELAAPRLGVLRRSSPSMSDDVLFRLLLLDDVRLCPFV
jgi:hypothetical protein